MEQITVQNLDQFTAQQVFDYVTAKVIQQGQRSVDDLGNCKYRLFDDRGAALKCAAGHLIPDQYYDEQMEECSYAKLVAIDSGDETFTPFHANFSEAHKALINALQVAHDNATGEFIPEFIEHAKEVAERYDLHTKNLTAHE